MITLQNLTMRREERLILDHVNLQINEGEQWVILGRNGSGKTTILEMINGYLFPSSGRVEVMGHVYGQVDVREVRKKIGYISQSLMEKLNLSDPVWEVAATGEYGFLRFYQEIPGEVKEKALHILEQLNILHLAEKPLGVLSQGERKKAMLARVIMSDPSLLILDEPCSGLDLYEREKLLADLEQLSKKPLQMVYVTHHIEEIMPFFTHTAVVHEGKILASGHKEDVLKDELFKQVFDVDVKLVWDAGRPWLHVQA
ncbi:ABC transporter ATP-binding protein [Marinicrinis lubricantis]|uniref:ABC transporter ATP-binding protein n=1 Tax=Marinicrinis lubricantis TaxID=2086470 RepID=A0ABW1ITH4_9BACL